MTHFKKLILTILLVLVTLSATAMDLNTAKSRGFLGEQQNGYLGLVNPNAPGDAKTLRQVNDQRRANYQSIARSNGIDLKSVESLQGRKDQQDCPGHYIRAPNGQCQEVAQSRFSQRGVVPRGQGAISCHRVLVWRPSGPGLCR